MSRFAQHCNDYELQIVEQSQESQRNSTPLPNRTGNFRGACVAKANCQQGPQQAATIHRQRWNHVERRQKQVHRHEVIDDQRVELSEANKIIL
jgi:hypothetical protein